LNYIRGLLKSVPKFKKLIENETGESIELRNGVTIEVVTASLAAPRGRAYALVIIEEAAFLPSDQSVNPDAEIVNAVEPGLARVEGSLLCVISSPYARRGILWDAWTKHQDGHDPDVLLVKAPTWEMNPAHSRRAIDKAFEKDPAKAKAEYGAEFRTDVEGFVSLEVVQHNTIKGRREVPPAAKDLGVRYCAFVDAAGGTGGDSFTLAIGHREDAQIVVDLLREWRPPFSPSSVIKEIAALLKKYRVSSVTGDRFSGGFAPEEFRKNGISYKTSAKSKSELYLDLISRLNSGGIELLDYPRANAQLLDLERTPSKGGQDSIDHPRGGHDDLANAIAGLSEATPIASGRRVEATWGDEAPPPPGMITQRYPGCYDISMPRDYRGLPPEIYCTEMTLDAMFGKSDEGQPD
jgi:hypothetical protein